MKVSESTGDTRSRIQAVALELFTEEGYEKTSLREIAERLGVTKAALYYHFKSKDEIVNSFVQDRIDIMDRLVEWGESQPPTAESRRTLLARYADDLFGNNRFSVMRFFEQNQTALKSLSAGKEMRARMIRLADLLARPETSHEAQVRAALSLFSVHSTWFAIRDPNVTSEQRREIGLKIAYELLDKITEDAVAVKA
ncbi:TetR/AcrR family transcriptional regulator [Phytohabitans sp. ZYX-F-186]|uniref:TetR/AcrR family transcriptional regulator n=1 Tax=Phytohabitans maris TaxID=3071409 RepID=A0ABU0ZPJ4_9ACTN|nr:TetR/AcrR family transcriptional regulator [Phytohabitans sp. ZYX-F-186]MDQ7908958.1 TetR/AcrR family transcriptional regulator [Phytohabitans sp. ZYX-F-186]